MSEVIVSGTFRSDVSLKSAMAALKSKGISFTDVSYASAPKSDGKIFDFKPKTKALEGTAIGMIIGAIAGALLLFGRFEGVLLSRIGDPVASGPWIAALIGSVPGFVIGALMGWLLGRRIPMFEAAFIQNKDQENPLLLGVSVDEERAEEIDSLLQSKGATHVFKLDKKLQTEVGL